MFESSLKNKNKTSRNQQAWLQYDKNVANRKVSCKNLILLQICFFLNNIGKQNVWMIVEFVKEQRKHKI